MDESIQCGNCGNDIEPEEYDRIGVDEYCDSCDLECADPRGHTFGNCGCESE